MSMAKRLFERRRRGQSLRAHLKFDDDIRPMDKERGRLMLRYGADWAKEYWKRYPRVYLDD